MGLIRIFFCKFQLKILFVFSLFFINLPIEYKIVFAKINLYKLKKIINYEKIIVSADCNYICKCS